MAMKQKKAMMALSSALAADWASNNPPVPASVIVYESDTGLAKIGNGTDRYNDLHYSIGFALSEADKALLDKVNLVGGVIELDADGSIPVSFLPGVIRGTVSYVADIAERDASTLEERDSRFFMVHDATDDNTVEIGGALYGWYNNNWIKIAEYESLDKDITVFLNKTTENIDNILDGVQFVRTTVEERAKLAGLEEGATATTAAHVAAAGAVMQSHQLVIGDLASASLFAPVLDTVIMDMDGYYVMKDGSVATHPDDYKIQALETGQTLTNGFYMLDLDGDGVATPHFVDMEGTGLVTYGLLTVN